MHPDYKSSKKNLWRKYKWYKSRMSQVQNEQEGVSDTESSKEVKTEPAAMEVVEVLSEQVNQTSSSEFHH